MCKLVLAERWRALHLLEPLLVFQNKLNNKIEIKKPFQNEKSTPNTTFRYEQSFDVSSCVDACRSEIRTVVGLSYEQILCGRANVDII